MTDVTRHGIETAHGIPRCTAHSRTGEQCGQRPIPGGTVCRWHGGSILHVRSKAQERLLAAVDPAITEMLRIMRKGDTDTVRLRAAEAVLDRAGYSRLMTMGNISEVDATPILVERIREWADGQRADPDGP